LFETEKAISSISVV